MKKNSVFLFVLLTAVIACMICVVLAVDKTSFSDIPENAYYADAAQRMAERGILSGYGDDENRFGGEDTVTRAQIATLICKMLGKVEEAKALAGATVFDDLADTHWATGYVNYAVANGIVSGDGDGNFRPEDPVKYEEVVKVVVCALYPNETFPIDPADWSRSFLEAAEEADLLQSLIGKKGEPMKRSDIAVIADAAMAVLDAAEKEIVVPATAVSAETTAEPAPAETTAEPAPAETTAEPAPAETTTEPAPAETTLPVMTEEEPEEVIIFTLGPNDTPLD